MRRSQLVALVSVVVLGGASLFILIELQPHLLLLNTTPSGGDTGAHVWGPAYLRDHLLHHGRLSGWAPDWYAGFPWLTFYFPLPSILIVVLSQVLPYGIAFKLVTIAGLLTLPLAAWAFGTLAEMPSPGPLCMAVATVPFVFDRTFTIYGGNIPSTLAGEFSFSISLSLMLVFLGVFARGLRTGRHRWLAASLLAAVAVCHVVPVFFAVAGAAVLTVQRLGRRRLLWAGSVLAAGGAVAAFWVVPFLMRLPYTNDMGWEKIRAFHKTLLPGSDRWVLLLALLGAVVALALRRRVGIFLTVMAALSAAAFVWAPQGRLWNARLLPFWVLCLYLLAGTATAEVGRFVGLLVGLGSDLADLVARLVTPVAVLVAALLLVAFPLQQEPTLHFERGSVEFAFGHVGKDGNYSWLGLHSADRSFIPDWVKWNYSGYERKASYPEYRGLIQTMAAVSRRHGCGRAMWEYEPELDRLGTPMALMLLPYWTHGCVGSMEGLFFESSATTPYHFLNQSELSKSPSQAQRDLPYRTLDVASGVPHLQLLGVRYYMALSDEAKGQARQNADLRLVATSGPWNATYARADLTGEHQRTWEIYEVADSDIVAPLQNEPVVMRGVAKGGKPWLRAAVAWYQDANRWDVPLAVDGPSSWRRVNGPASEPPRRAVEPVSVSHIRTGDDRISFDVDHVGSPVLVKASYFPNWQASGARGVWRVTPNQMVVIPTSRHVSLHYGWTPVDVLGWLLTAVGLGAVVWFAVRGPVEFPEPPELAGTSAPGEGDALERELAGILVEEPAASE